MPQLFVSPYSLQRLRTLHPDEVKVLMVLADVANHPKPAISMPDLAYGCNMTIEHVVDVLADLEETWDLIKLDGVRRKKLTFNEQLFIEKAPTITITDERPEQTIEALEAKIRQLEKELAETQAGSEDGLIKWLKGEEQHLVREIVSFYGRPLNPLEAYYLGQMIQGYGIPRVKKAFYMRKGNHSPLRSAYALLKAGASGKPAAEKESTMPKVHYKDLMEGQ